MLEKAKVRSLGTPNVAAPTVAGCEPLALVRPSGLCLLPSRRSEVWKDPVAAVRLHRVMLGRITDIRVLERSCAWPV